MQARQELKILRPLLRVIRRQVKQPGLKWTLDFADGRDDAVTSLSQFSGLP
jgi:hypothetical protein